jgi:hypothetical protein
VFPYSDPAGSGLLERAGALGPFRTTVDQHYDRAAREPRSAFTWLEAFRELAQGSAPQEATIACALWLPHRDAEEAAVAPTDLRAYAGPELGLR